MSIPFRIFVITLILAGTSCSKKKESQLKISFGKSESFIIPGKADDCEGTEQSGPRFTFPAAVDWQGDDDLHIVLLRIRFKSELVGGTYTCDLSGSVLNATFGSTDSELDANLLPVGPGYLTSVKGKVASICTVRCFGVTPKSDKTPFKIIGEAKLLGYSRNRTTQDEKPVTARASVFIRFDP